MQSEIKVPEFKIRCSAIGQIMTNPAGKSVAEKIAELEQDLQERKEKFSAMKPGLKTTEKAAEMIDRKGRELVELYLKVDEPNLSATCKTFLKTWLDEKIYQRRIEFTSKQTDKGIVVEEDAIIYAAAHIDEMGFVSKNLHRFSNDFMHGEPDVINDNYVFDIKSSWTHGTFPLYDSEIPETAYAWQVLGYMELTKKQKGSVIFCLMSMPEDMIRKEARWKLPEGYTEAEYEEFAAQFRYDELPPYLRIKQYDVEYNEEKIESIKTRVNECRKYIETVLIPEVEKNFKKFQK